MVARQVIAMAAAALLVAGAGSACAQVQAGASGFYRLVAAGKRVKITAFSSLDPTCRSIGHTAVNLVGQPQGGTVEEVAGSDFPNFAQSNVRFACNRRRVPSTLLFYRASSGFSGNDSFEVEAVYPDGTARRYRYSVTVR